jgi:hypothetical protein
MAAGSGCWDIIIAGNWRKARFSMRGGINGGIEPYKRENTHFLKSPNSIRLLVYFGVKGLKSHTFIWLEGLSTFAYGSLHMAAHLNSNIFKR